MNHPPGPAQPPDRPTSASVRRADAGDAPDVARLLHDFNTEYSDPTPGVAVLTERTRSLLERGEIVVFLGGDGPDGIAVLRLRPSFWTGAPDA